MRRSVFSLSLVFAVGIGTAVSFAGARPLPLRQSPSSVGSSSLVARNGVVVPRERRLPLPTLPSLSAGWKSARATTGRGLLYVADQSAAAVEIYEQAGKNQQPIGSITQGISGVDGLFVDHKLNLYACNFGNGTVTVYPPGSTTPSETLTGAGSPKQVVVALNGTVYVSNFNSGTNGTVLKYPKGHTTPSKTIVTFGTGSFPEGLAIDSAKNLYVAYNTNDGEVLEFSPGSPSGKNLGIHVGYVGGMTIDTSNDILLDDQNLPGVDVFPPGKTTPSKQYKMSGLAYSVALNKKNTRLWITNPFSPPSVNELTYPDGVIVDTITSLKSAFGVATSPEGSK